MAKIQTAWQDGRDYAKGELDKGRWPITDDYSFAAACYSGNSLEELNLEAVKCTDSIDCKEWDLTPYEWAYQIGMAYEAKADKK